MVEFRPVGRVQVSLWGRKVVNDGLASLDEPDALREIIRVGSSAGGAQAKAIVGWNRTTGAFMMGDRDVPET